MTILFRRFGPFFFIAVDQGGVIFCKNSVLLHQGIDGALVLGEVVCATGVAFGNGLARVAGLLAA
jgi:hypothetical protein